MSLIIFLGKKVAILFMSLLLIKIEWASSILSLGIKTLIKDKVIKIKISFGFLKTKSP